MPSLPIRTEPCVRSLFIAEAIGTFLLVFFGCGVVHAAVLTGAQSGLWQVAIVWGVGLMLAIYCVGGVSGAHLNPAMTLAFAVWRGHPWRQVPWYIGGQLCGAFVAAAVLFVAFQGSLEQHEQRKSVVRGELGSVITAMCYGEYYPNPGELSQGPTPFDQAAYESWFTKLPESSAFLIELIGTAILALVVFALTDKAQGDQGPGLLTPMLIGLTVAALISLFAPLTQASYNPARDFGPRLFAYFAGWGEAAIPGPNGRGFFTVYIVAPCLGALLGAGVYQSSLRRARVAMCGASS